MCNEAWLTAAWEEIRQNQGSNTPGIDGKTREDVDTDMICKISLKLKNETFRPQPVKRRYIPKRNGKLRPLGIPMVPSYCTSILGDLGITVVGEWTNRSNSVDTLA